MSSFCLLCRLLLLWLLCWLFAWLLACMPCYLLLLLLRLLLVGAASSVTLHCDCSPAPQLGDPTVCELQHPCCTVQGKAPSRSPKSKTLSKRRASRPLAVSWFPCFPRWCAPFSLSCFLRTGRFASRRRARTRLLFDCIRCSRLQDGCIADVCASTEVSIDGPDGEEDSTSGICCLETALVAETSAEDALAIAGAPSLLGTVAPEQIGKRQTLLGCQVSNPNHVAIAAEAEAVLATCSDNVGDLMATARASATAVANATAAALAGVDTFCSSTDSFSYACAATDATVEAVVNATATAFASGWASAVSCGDCSVEVDNVIETVAPVLATASLSVYQNVCVQGALIQLVFLCDRGTCAVVGAHCCMCEASPSVHQSACVQGARPQTGRVRQFFWSCVFSAAPPVLGAGRQPCVLHRRRGISMGLASSVRLRLL